MATATLETETEMILVADKSLGVWEAVEDCL